MFNLIKNSDSEIQDLKEMLAVQSRTIQKLNLELEAQDNIIESQKRVISRSNTEIKVLKKSLKSMEFSANYYKHYKDCNETDTTEVLSKTELMLKLGLRK
jgi:septal ring factor EnvC (AmiA/AmiB activator)